MSACLACLVVASALSIGCASGPSPLSALKEARSTLERARSSETVDSQAIEEAEGALSYAEKEYQLSPDHPLSRVRAEKALAKARAALGTTIASRPSSPPAQ